MKKETDNAPTLYNNMCVYVHVNVSSVGEVPSPYLHGRESPKQGLTPRAIAQSRQHIRWNKETRRNKVRRKSLDTRAVEMVVSRLLLLRRSEDPS